MVRKFMPMGIVVVFFLANSFAATIQSVATGGLWEDTLTWVGYKIPGAADDAVINGIVSVTSSSSQCNNLTVSSASVLQNGGSLGWIDFTVLGNAINNGTIRNNPAANVLNVNYCGDITNNGVWVNSATYITSQRAQTISQASGTVFGGGSFKKKNTGGYSDTFPLIAGSDLVFNASEIEFLGSKDGIGFWGKFNLAGHDLTLSGAMPLGRTVLSGIRNLIFNDSTSIYSSVIYDAVTLKGAATLTDDNVTFNGVVTNADTLQNGGSLGWLAGHFKAKLINNGIVRSNPRGRQFNVELAADIVNNGKWLPGQTYFMSRQDQTISQAAGTQFCGVITRKSVSGYSDMFPLIAASDLVINSPSFDCMGNDSGTAFWSKIDMANHDLTLAGATSLTNAAVYGVKNFVCIDSSAIASCSINDAVTIKGKFTITDANVNFYGLVTNADTLQNGGSLGWLAAHFNGKLINNGLIRSNPRGNQFNIELAGDVVNNGKWLPGQTYFVSKIPQTISQAAGTEFCGVITKKSVSGYADTFPLIAASDLVFNSPSFECMGAVSGGPNFWGTIDCAGNNLTLKNATPLQNTVVLHADTLFCVDSSSVASISIVGPATLAGAFTITNANVTISGVATIIDTLQNGGGLGWLSLCANGGIVNRGVIRNNPRGNTFNISIGKNVENYGVWKNGQNTLVDSVNQTINLLGGRSIAAAVAFDALWANGPYAWQKNDSVLGSWGKTLTLDSLTAGSSGVYRCKHDSASSRTMTVQLNAVSVLSERPMVQIQPQVLKFAWKMMAQKRPSLSIQSPASFTFSLTLFDLRGRVVSSMRRTLASGIHEIPIRGLSCGSYIAALQTDVVRESRKMLVME